MDLTLGYVIVYVPDVEASLSFYERAFGLAVRFRHDSGAYAELDTGTTVLAFAEERFAEEGNGIPHRSNRPGDLPPGVSITLVSEDLPSLWSRAVGAGAAVVSEPVTKPWGQVVGHVRDVDGVLVELATPVPTRPDTEP